MDHTFWAWEIRTTLCTLLKQCIIWIKNALTNQLEPLLSKPPRIDAFLIMELNTELLLPAINLYILELFKGILEDLSPPDLDLNFIFLIPALFF